MNSQKSWILCCFFNFLIACVFGLLLRFMYLFPLDFLNYSFLLHAHSHVAMLGWVYMIVFVLIVHFFIPKQKSQKPIYNRLFWLTEFSVIGMMIAFPIQGYALFSIIFSTMHILLSYVFCRLVWKDSLRDKSPSQRLLLVSILFIIVSTFGVWCLGPAVSTLGKQSAFYQIAIQFFLHFQFNGWFILAILALFLKQFQNKIDEVKFSKFYFLMLTATLLTLAFPVRWFIQSDVLSYINGLGVLIQFTAFIYFYKMLKPQINHFTNTLGKTTKSVYVLALCSLFLKVGIQLLTIFPNLAEVSHQIRNFVIGFIHLTTLGIITGFLLGILLQNKMLSPNSTLLKTGVKCFISGYILTEVLLFLQGLFFFFGEGSISGYYQGILIFSIFLVLGLALIMASLTTKRSLI
ncbi:cbb3-type cytochrome c oxidase subunit I [Flavobacterium hibisci]|uniref:cbb3-type cytochrome c oxidase subunit I n=1 Tax=Flavobacterium hibisci TaxID=1914462 RepID=UPI001CBDD8A2|nr:cbb3-type cytochrome c oxidase subunit I [Flavobacterium hibisci]MBZ4044744.1 cbb3-type cytochrome c oxidase subunit I [Flavobacterium hibisci]